MRLRVREFRRQLGLKQRDLAARSQCSRELISAIETSRYCPKVDLLKRIATVLQVPLWTLFEDDDPPATDLPPGSLPT